MRRSAVILLVLMSACSGNRETTAFIQLPSRVSPDDAQNHVEAACELLFTPVPKADRALREATEAVRLDDKWSLFYLALTDSADGTQDWFEVGTDERVVNLTCQGPPEDTADLEVELRRPLSEFERP